jgi:1-acyl-sn-glycerol-3-phosphate acyltransferase
MRDRLERGWRVLATQLCFLTFGLGGVVFLLAAVPLLHLLVRDADRRVVLARRLIRLSFRAFVGMMCATNVISVEIRGADRLRGRGRLILANHPTLIDVVLLMSVVEQCDCVVKGALGRNPFTRGPVGAAGFVTNDGGEALLEDCVRSVRAGSNLLIFPEGTRSVQGEPLKLQRGAARIAVHGELDITPVRIRSTPPTLTKGRKWWQVPPRCPHIRIEVDAPIAVAGFIAAAPHPALAARHLNRHLTEYFSKEHELASA